MLLLSEEEELILLYNIELMILGSSIPVIATGANATPLGGGGANTAV